MKLSYFTFLLIAFMTEQTIEDLDFKVEMKDTKGAYPRNLENAPVELKAKGKKIAEWVMYQDSAGPLPVSGQHRYEKDHPTKDVEDEQSMFISYRASTLRRKH